MATLYTSAVTTPAVSTTGTLQRDVSDQIRELWPDSAPMNSLIAAGTATAGNEVTAKGRIGKRVCKTMKPEAFVYTPISVGYVVASLTGSDPLTPVVSSGTGLRVNQTVINARTNEVGVIDAISSTTNLTITAVSGSTWTGCAVGDYLVSLAPAYKEGSSSVGMMTIKSEDQIYNDIQIMRFPVEIAISAKNNPNYGGDLWKNIKQRGMTDAKRALENAMLFSQRATAETGTSTSNLGTVRTMRGLEKWAALSFDANGAMNAEKFRSNLGLSFGDTVNDNDDYVMFCGRRIFSDVQSWIYDKWESPKSGEIDVAGLKSFKIITAGPTITVIKHNAYDQLGMQTKALVFRPDDVFYYAKEGLDLQVNQGIQTPDSHTQKDEIFAYATILPVDGGANIMSVTNWSTPGAA